ncbi:hypothetical protein [Aerosakkonema funiforme]|uniref:hypothetical protein n=1 Tax=Aerosakkonema funiforme TaxID=1246630 RepID=UPI0035BC7AA9
MPYPIGNDRDSRRRGDSRSRSHFHFLTHSHASKKPIALSQGKRQQPRRSHLGGCY